MTNEAQRPKEERMTNRAKYLMLIAFYFSVSWKTCWNFEGHEVCQWSERSGVFLSEDLPNFISDLVRDPEVREIKVEKKGG